MTIKIDGIYNISSNIENKLNKNNLLSFQFKFLDTCFYDGIITEDDIQKYCIMWDNNCIYKYRNLKENEYIYNFLLYESFNINAYLLCLNEEKKSKSGKNIDANISLMKDLCGKIEINVQDIILNKVNNSKYKIKIINEENDVETFIFNDAYIILSIQFYKQFINSVQIEYPCKLNKFKNYIQKDEGEEGEEGEESEKGEKGEKGEDEEDEEKKKEHDMNENITILFNESILEGINFINKEIDKLKEKDKINIYKNSKDYLSFIDKLKNKPTYKNIYNNLKKVMFKITYEIINKEIYRHFNLYDDEENETKKNINDESDNEINIENENDNNITDKNEDINIKEEKHILSENNLNYIYTKLFDYFYESTNVLINNYFELNENCDEKTIKEIKEEKQNENFENCLYNIIIENEFLLKNKKNQYYYEALLLLLFEHFSNYCQKNVLNIIKQQNNHIISIIENISEDEIKNNIENSTNIFENEIFYKNKILNEDNDNITYLINKICKNNKNNYNSYLFAYIENYNYEILNKYDKNIEKENKENKEKQNNINNISKEIIDVLNLEEMKEKKKLFVEILYKYCKILLIKNNTFFKNVIKINSNNKENINEYIIKNKEEYNTKKDDINELTRNIQNFEKEYDEKENNENDIYYDTYDVYNSYEDYNKYINSEINNMCILCLKCYIELTNFKNIESIFFLGLLQLNDHKYDEAIKCINYILEILRKKNIESKKKKEVEIQYEFDMKKLYIEIAYENFNNLNINENLCTFVKALCHFLQKDYIQYYVNIGIILNTDLNNIKNEIENNETFFNDEIKKYNTDIDSNKKGKKKDPSYISKDDKKSKNISKVLSKENDIEIKEENREINENKEDKENNKRQNDLLNYEEESDLIEKKNEYNKNNQENFNTVNDVCDKFISHYLDVDIEDIPLKDKYILLFLIYCIKLNIINIVMYIYEKKKNFLTEKTLKTNLFTFVIIKTFFAIRNFSNCIQIIEEKKNEYLTNIDILYIYAESLYKIKKYNKSIEYFNEYLNLCKYTNFSASIFLQMFKMYFYLKNYKECKNIVNKSLQTFKSSYSYLQLSKYYLIKKKYLNAYKFLYKSSNFNFLSPHLWCLMTIVFLHLNMKNQADNSLNNFLKIKKYDKELISDLIETYKQYGYEHEKKYLLKLIENNENNRNEK